MDVRKFEYIRVSRKIKMKDDNFRPCWIMFLKNVISRSLQDGPID